MWKLYLKSGEGIALQTSFGCLRGEINKSQRLIYVGRVQYLDYENDSIPGGTLYPTGSDHVVGTLSPLIHKRRGFAHENEIRFVFQDSFNSADDPSEAEFGIPLSVSVPELVEAIYVAPGTPKWLRDTAQSVTNKFGVAQDSRVSEFDEAPPTTAA